MSRRSRAGVASLAMILFLSASNSPAKVEAPPAADLPTALRSTPGGAAKPEDGLLRPLVHLVDWPGMLSGPDSSPSIRLFSINDVTRPVFSMAKAYRTTADCQPDPKDPDAPCVLRPGAGKGPRWFILDPVEAAPKRLEARDRAQDHVVGPLPQPRVRLAGTRPNDPPVLVPHHDALGVRALGVTPLRRRTVTTSPRAIPPQAVLRFSIATEPSTWTIDSAPVDFIVSSLTGPAGRKEETELHRVSLDPTRRPEERRWNDHEVSLAALAGTSPELRFKTIASQPGDQRPQLPLWGDPAIFAPASPRPKRPFVVLLSLDTLRARSLSALGREIETSPYFDSLARQGTLFERAFTTYSNTLGSHMSMHTGLWPRNHAIVKTGAVLEHRKQTLAERMRAAGYETAAFTENALLSGPVGFNRGFGRYAENKNIGPGAGLSRDTFASALSWVAAHRRIPFFLFVHTYEVHAPYEPHSPYDTVLSPHDHAGTPLERYEQEIRYLDDQLRHFVNGLDRLVGAENLLVVITADHGEEFGEHGRQLHVQLYDEVMHVPLLLRWPGTVPAGRRIAQPVSIVDIPPTILNLAGVRRFRTPDGLSLVPLLKDEPLAPRKAVFGEAVASRQRTFVARSATHKCMLTEKAAESICFDLDDDPGETTGLPWNQSASTRTLHEELLAYRGDQQEPSQGPPGEENDSSKIDPKREQKLRALGYVE